MGDTSLLEQTRAFWQARTARQLTLEDARQITENLTGFFKLLVAWGARQNGAKGSQEATGISHVDEDH